MSSRAKNFRRRTEDSDPNTEEPKPNPNPKLHKPKPPKPRAALSFADDEEEAPQINTSFRPNRKPVNPNPIKLTSSKDRVKGKKVLTYSSTPSNFQSQAGEYTKEKLLELQKNARPLGSMPKPPSISGLDLNPVKPNNQSEPVIVLKGLVKPVIPSTSKNHEDEDEEDEEEEEEIEKGSKLLDIPDQATINAIKAKRLQSLQPRQAAPDFISLDGGDVISSRHGTGGSSDDEDDMELDGRIALLGDKHAITKGVFENDNNTSSVNNEKFKNLGLREEKDQEVDEEDEEERKWEEEQLRKGMGRRLDESTTILPPVNLVSAPRQHPSVFVSRSAEVMSFAQQAEVAIRSIRNNITKLSQSHKTTLTSLTQIESFLSEALLEISSLEISMEADDKKYAFMQQLREYVSVLCDFLKDKAFYIEELEEQMKRLHEKRALAVSDRRADDFTDESSEMEPAIKAALSVLESSRSSSQISSTTTSARAAALAAKEASRSFETELDEFGRDVNLKRRLDFARRAEGRKKRKIRHESKRMNVDAKNGINSVEGEFSTDESEGENDAYISSRDELLKTAKMVFSDASEEYANLKFVKERFDAWKNRYGQTYRDAYVSLSVPLVFSPYVRLELLKWDPLYDTTDFVDMPWHDELFDYGQQNGNPNFDSEDSDSNLIPELVEKVALPILHHEIEHCWDVFSTQKTKNAVSASKMVIGYLSSSSKGLNELLSMVAVRLNEAVNGLDVPLWGPNVIKAVPGAGELSAYRFGMSVRLLRNICLWKDVLVGSVVEKIALDELLRAKILPHVKSMGLEVHDAVLRLERVVESISGLVSGPGSRGAKPLVDFVKDLGVKLEKRHKLGASVVEVHALARRLKNMMVALNDYDGARAILKEFQIKEAL